MDDMTEPAAFRSMEFVAGEAIPAGHPVGVNQDGALVVRKYGGTIPISRSELVWNGLVKPTGAEQRAMDERHAEYEARRRSATEAWPLFVAALDAVTDPLGRAVLDLHANRDGDCGGCAFNGYEAEPDAWPCPTTTLVAEKLGIPMPPDLDMAEQARRW